MTSRDFLGTPANGNLDRKRDAGNLRVTETGDGKRSTGRSSKRKHGWWPGPGGEPDKENHGRGLVH